MCLSIHQSVHQSYIPRLHFEVSLSVEFHIMRLVSVHSVILGLNLLCGVKKLVLWG